MSDLSPSHQKANAAFLKVQKQSITRDRIFSDIADSNSARTANMAKLRELRLAREQKDAIERAAAAALPKTRSRRTKAA
ncbi:MAG: hypothetical protein Q8O26_15610 [Phreatobacter sp.]|uniref:hypothetical protein n=1 Tax=Phreatobacter sp. TaxID=1966341 RepID=UPI002732A165|nr:hypothetical protein [Phreatobacter sp.]MDP2803299.1 hypothetical protein [Phreatobacter sp.]